MKRILSLGLLLVLAVGMMLTGCSESHNEPETEKPVNPFEKTGIHRITVEQAGDVEAFNLGLVFMGLTLNGSANLYDGEDNFLGQSFEAENITQDHISCITEENSFFLSCAGTVKPVSDEPGKTLKVTVTAFINGKEVNRLTKEYTTPTANRIESFTLSTNHF